MKIEMTPIQRNVVIFVVTAIILFLGIMFWPFVYSNIVYPVSIVFWLLLRIFVLSIDQQCIWGVLIIAIALLILQWIMQQIKFSDTQELDTAPITALKDIEFWRIYFSLPIVDDREGDIIKRELIHLLVTMYASKQKDTADFHVLDELRKGQIALPENIRGFLFPEKPTHQKRSLKWLLQTIGQAPQLWLYRRSGRKKEDFYRMVNEVLSFMESSLEMNNDNE